MSVRKALAGLVLAMLVVVAPAARSTSAARAGEAPPRLVLAHYMACCPFAGPDASVTDLAAEIDTALAAGIDGFSVNFGAYAAEPHYQRIIGRLFEAAARFPRFHLVLSFDQMAVEDSIAVAARYAAHPSALRRQGVLVASAWAVTPRWTERFTAGLRSRGIDVSLVPNVLIDDRGLLQKVMAAASDTSKTRQILDRTSSVAGLFTFGAGRPYGELAAEIRTVSSLLGRRGLVHMAGISPFYRGLASNAVVFESDGFKGMRKLWLAAIESGTPWVQLVTWNDWNEATYLHPFGQPLVTVWKDHPAWQRLPDHGGFLQASRYYIDWFKSGRPPTIDRDRVFYFHQLHPKSAEGIVDFAPRKRGRPRYADRLTDRVHLATFLTAPAEIILWIGGTTHVLHAPAGPAVLSAPMSIGSIAVELNRAGAEPARAVLPLRIEPFADPGNFNYVSGEAALERP